MKKWIKFYLRLLSFCVSIFFRISRFHSDVRLRARLLATLRSLFTVLESDGLLKTTADSKRIYESYNDREIHEEELFEETRYLNSVVVMKLAERRQRHLAYLYEEIDQLLLKQATVDLLEVGCGNLLNAKEVVSRYGKKVRYHGLDISMNRIRIGLEHYGEMLDASQFYTMSITERTLFCDNQFDLVFSMHCLEQIAYDCSDAIKEMYRICKYRIVMIEPVFENGDLLQKSYLLLSDHTRVILRSLNELGLTVITNQVCETQTNLVNQSSLLVVEKQ